jgi:type I restriction enzyme S subunit
MSAVLVPFEEKENNFVHSNFSLITNLEDILTATAGVENLRRLILSLAIRGRLVAQAQNSEPAGIILEHAQKQKSALISSGKIKQGKPIPPLQDNEIPFQIPVGWQWARLGMVATRIQYGYTASAAPNQPGPRLLRITDIQNDRVNWSTVPGVEAAEDDLAPYHLEAGDLLIARTGGTIGKTFLIREIEVPSVFASYLIRVSPTCGISPAFLKVFAGSDLYWHQLLAASMGTGQPNVNSTSLSLLKLPLPPFEEQNRIVVRVEELMQLCDALEQNNRLVDKQHAALTSTLFDALISSESAHALAENWQLVAKHFDVLLDRPENIDNLEQTILELAVRGRLSAYQEGEEHAENIIHRIEKKSSNSKKNNAKTNDDLELANAPYELPSHWRWAPLGNLVENMGSGWSPACEEGERIDSQRWAVLRTTAVQVMQYQWREHKTIPNKLSGRPEIEVHKGDILITRAGPMNRVGISCLVDETPSRLMLSDKIIRFHAADAELVPAFIVLALNAGWTREQINSAKTGMAASQVNISQSDLRRVTIPICSKSEQIRILSKVEELRDFCSRARESLSRLQEVKNKIAEAMLNKALG